MKETQDWFKDYVFAYMTLNSYIHKGLKGGHILKLWVIELLRAFFSSLKVSASEFSFWERAWSRTQTRVRNEFFSLRAGVSLTVLICWPRAFGSLASWRFVLRTKMIIVDSSAWIVRWWIYRCCVVYMRYSILRISFLCLLSKWLRIVLKAIAFCLWSACHQPASLLFYLPFLREGYQLPLETLESTDKRHTDTVCYFTTCLLGTIAGHYSLPPGKVCL